MKPSKNLENKAPSDLEEFSQYVRKFFRTTTDIQAEPDTLDKPKFIMTFLTMLGVTEILCSFRLVLERKIGNEIP